MHSNINNTITKVQKQIKVAKGEINHHSLNHHLFIPTFPVIRAHRLQLTAFCELLRITPLCNSSPATNNTNL